MTLKNIWTDVKWVLNYMASIVMYAIIVILLLVGFLVLLYFIDVNKNVKSGVWEPPLYGAYVIISPSMHPVIKVYDAIVIKRADEADIRVGDVITYKSENPSYYGIMITHRVIDTYVSNGEMRYVTKGDANVSSDQLAVREDQVYGKVVMRIPKIGYLQYFLSTATGWIIAIVVPCLGIIIYDIMKLVKTIRNNVRSKKRRDREIKNEG